MALHPRSGTPGETSAPDRDRSRAAALVEVAVALPLRGTFTYRVGEACKEVEPGFRVIVPFGPRKVTGYVLGFAKSAPEGTALKTLFACLDATATVPEDVLQLCRWAADYYLHPVGEVIRTALPPGINVKSERWARITDDGRSLLRGGNAGADRPELPAAEAALLEEIVRQEPLGMRIGGGGGLAPGLAARLSKRGLVVVDSRMNAARVKPKTVERITGTVSREALDDALKVIAGASVQAAMLEWLVARGSVLGEELRAAFPRGRPALKRLVERGMATIEEVELDRSPGGGPGEEILAGEVAVPVPTADQTSALEELVPAMDRGFSPFLLQGVTGSGKTEVYLRLITRALERGRGALVLVPEIALTPQLAGRFRARFQNDVAVLHSGLSEGERHDEWWRLRRGEARVAVGVRSAVFAPVADLGVIVVDEEHDGSFKQEEGLRYQARDLAMVRAKGAGAVVLLGSATPSMESLHNAHLGRYGHLRLPCRVEGRPLPAISMVDLRSERPRPPVDDTPGKGDGAGRGASFASAEQRSSWLLSDPLVTALEETITAGKQAILFLNRRGYTPSLICVDCGEPRRCRSCDVSLTLHRKPYRMLCHYCGAASAAPVTCEACGGELQPIGVGTQRIEEEVHQRLPRARVSRLDRDTTSKRGALARLLADFALGRSDVLVGTQMVAKGHDFPGVTLVGVVMADTSLSIPDFRASERTFQLMAQVSGRAGRGDDPGRVFLQSWRPNHPAVALAAAGDFDAFFAGESTGREAGRWPPFCRLLMVRVEGEGEGAVESTAERLTRRAEAAAMAHPEADVEVLGPAPAPLSKVRGRSRWQVLIKAPSTRVIHWLGEILAGVEPTKGVDVALDVDPVGML